MRLTKIHVKQLGSNALPMMTNKADTEVVHFLSLHKSALQLRPSFRYRYIISRSAHTLFDYFEIKMNGNALSSKYKARNATHQTGQEFSLHNIFSLHNTFSGFTVTYTAALL